MKALVATLAAHGPWVGGGAGVNANTGVGVESKVTVGLERNMVVGLETLI